MSIKYRQGTKADCHRIAELDYIASDGAVEYLFHDLIPGQSPLKLLCDGLEKDVYPYTFRSSIVAELGQNVIGVALSYPAHFHCITDDLRSFLPADRLERFHDFYSSRVAESYFLDAICVDESHRGFGIGSSLLKHTKEKASSEGYSKLSLIVFADNTRAVNFYEKQGFNVVKNIKLECHKLLSYDGGCLLMSVEI
ncbi:GNAT family N-acetyltransferase [Microbulbifer sp. A4B17]|uniref:GNAT family N-acetyltransferase n=1 Tax=Microbulbifer sp. A4B17 TaxID=359370 RepID=UPI000D52F094|nr:GNAT family N-acetyltransferase [Microbulbifer sp. A4B17]AWF81117.1 GNAT family N-acetyltransferase [Microbulbifer sp. A4B17]